MYKMLLEDVRWYMVGGPLVTLGKEGTGEASVTAQGGDREGGREAHSTQFNSTQGGSQAAGPGHSHCVVQSRAISQQSRT